MNVSIRQRIAQKSLLALAIALGACSSNNDNDTVVAVPPPPAPKAFASFVDKTSGLGILSDGTTSFTDATGKFEFTVARATSFFIGTSDKRIELGSTVLPANSTSDSIVTPRDFQGATENATYNILRLLQSLDKDRNIRNGIEVDAATNASFAAAFPASTALNVGLSAADFENLAPLKAALLSLNRPLISQAQAQANFSLNFAQPRSASLLLTSDDRKLVVANRQKASVSVIEVRNAAGADTQTLLAEVAVGREPRFVAIAPDNSRAYVTSAIDGSLSAIDLRPAVPVLLGSPIDVGLEPRGIAVSPTGRYAAIVNSTLGSVALVDLATFTVVQRIITGGNPHAVSISNNLLVAGPQMRQLNGPVGITPLLYLDNVGTFNAADALQIRGAGAVGGQVAQGFAPFGAAGFNTPSLLGFAFSGPWLHDGSAETVEEVFAKHKLPDGRTIEATVIDPFNRESLKQFVLSIDDQTPTMESDSDRFLRQRGN